jgi:hypothetical protein
MPTIINATPESVDRAMLKAVAQMNAGEIDSADASSAYSFVLFVRIVIIRSTSASLECCDPKDSFPKCMYRARCVSMCDHGCHNTLLSLREPG